MKRRTFNLLAMCSGAALGAGMGRPFAARAATPDKAALLKTTLTPFGAEKAGNADGSIPAWTGGMTQVPDGWTPDKPMPDLFPEEKSILTIDASNMDQYKDRLAHGVMLMMQKYGFSINVYPTHRTAAAPQWVYDNIYQNALNAQVAPGGGRFGFSGAYGGIPFPVPDMDDPVLAGSQVIWNHLTHWQGSHVAYDASFYSMANGQLTLLDEIQYKLFYDYYQQTGNVSNYTGYFSHNYLYGVAPASQNGAETIIWVPTNSTQLQEQGWSYLSGQGRVRKIPEIQYDIPESEDNGITVYDEAQVFYGAPDRFDWKVLGKKEMYIPYNCNGTNFLTRDDYGPHFINPEKVRWELHRVWILEATLHQGERNVIPHRILYLDEDTWAGVLADEYDAAGNYWVLNFNFPLCNPDVPGTFQLTDLQYNLQLQSYAHQLAYNVNIPLNQRTRDFVTVPSMNLFNPQNMAARAQF